MNNMLNLKKLSGTALCLALCLIIPSLFHLIGLGSTFLPMHIPVYLCGFCFGPFYGFICGIFGPIISSSLTGMPPFFPTAGIMSLELGTYGFLSGFFYRKLKLNIYPSLILSMLGGRLVGGIMALILNGINSFYESVITVYLITGLPGMILQIVLLPFLVYILERSKIIVKP